jgi:diguanylate cyclase (GGDEF)-like protein
MNALLALLAFGAGAVAGILAYRWRVRARAAAESQSGSLGGLPPGTAVGSTESLESVAFSVCEAARQATGRKTAIVLRDWTGQFAEILSVSHGTDRRLLGSRVTPESAAGRAFLGDVPIVGLDGRELFGQLRADRRRQDEGGTAFPLHDHQRQVIGSLVVLGRWDEVDSQGRARLMEALASGGPRVAAAAAVRAAELKAMTDELTGLWNRRALDAAMRVSDQDPCALALLDLDHFKNLNDTYGHTAGDAALRHVAAVLRRVLRGDDLAARVGGEEFALWFPNTERARATEVAERVRSAVAASRLQWAGAELTLTCSLGVATKPDIVRQTANLYAAADAALYAAKEAGRNRVQIALAAEPRAPAR